MTDYLGQLNEEQRQAVTAGDGPHLIIAGAGSGKTRVLTARIAYLLREKEVSPGSIMALTFTNKAAKEMRDRLQPMLGDEIRRMWVGTFHAICLKILRIDGHVLELSHDFVIYDDADQKSLIKGILKKKKIDESDLSPYLVLKAISDAKTKLLSAEAYEEVAVSAEEELIAAVYFDYQRCLRSNSALDFDDLLLYVAELFVSFPQVLQEYRRRFRYILVDEYQDTNEAQYRILRLLAGEDGNLFVVGDPDQSVYAFRGANIENILNFERDFPSAKVLRLEKNYRSGDRILRAANHLICHNKNRPEKNLWTDREGGKEVEVLLLSDERCEAQKIADLAQQLKASGDYPYKDMAVFYRTHAQSRVLEDILMRRGIPYKVYGGQRFYERKEIKDTIAYLRLIMNPNDDVSFLRVVNEPRRGIGGVTLERLQGKATEQGCSLWEYLEVNPKDADFKPAVKNALQAFVRLIHMLRSLSKEASITDLVEKLWDLSRYQNFWENEGSAEASVRLENMSEFLTITKHYDTENPDGSLNDFLAGLALSSDLDNYSEDEYLTLMTIHMAKGLEFSVVFLMGLEENIFPHVRSVLSGSENDIEEERRLCYVGITRAKDHLYILRTFKRSLWGRSMYNKASRFLEELDLPISAQEAAPSEPAPIEDFVLGDKVIHPKFGEGVIVSLDKKAETKAKIAFPDLGIKEFILVYASLRKV